jgi:hypothetical protein
VPVVPMFTLRFRKLEQSIGQRVVVTWNASLEPLLLWSISTSMKYPRRFAVSVSRTAQIGTIKIKIAGKSNVAINI